MPSPCDPETLADAIDDVSCDECGGYLYMGPPIWPPDPEHCACGDEPVCDACGDEGSLPVVEWVVDPGTSWSDKPRPVVARHVACPVCSAPTAEPEPEPDDIDEPCVGGCGRTTRWCVCDAIYDGGQDR